MAVTHAPAQEKRPAFKGHALLIGCTRYPNLGPEFQLTGPGNDVKLMEHVLREKLVFSPEKITVLSEAAGETRSPTYQNIEREFKRLAREAQAGDHVFILMCGHGSQQPADTDIPDNYEPDGFDETFLPRDVGPWDGGKVKVSNAIVDNQLGDWLKAIRARGAEVCIIVDSCHSGTMVRGSEEEKARQISPTSLIPKDVFDKARKEAVAKAKAQKPPAKKLVPDLVAIYAALPTESTYELPLPPGSTERKYYGILTYAICRVLDQAQTPLTYRELVHRVRAQYVAWGRYWPTPFLEGKYMDREFLGVEEWPYRSHFVLSKQAEDRWQINAGSLHGLGTGSVLAVYTPAGQGNKLLGYVKIKQCRILEADVVPIEYSGKLAVKDPPEGSRCEVVFVDYGEQRFRVAVAASEDPSKPEQLKRFQVEMKRLAESLKPGAVLELSKDANRANWLVKYEGGKVYLSPTVASRKTESPLFGPFPVDDQLADNILTNLKKIARAQNLLKLAGESGGAVFRGPGAVAVDVEIVRYRDEKDRKGTVVEWKPGERFADGDLIGFRLRNKGRTEADVSLLFIDNGFGIDPLFPEAGVVTDNRLPPGNDKSIDTPPFRVRSDKFPGPDHLVVIAVEAKGQPIDFTCLAQPTLARARGHGRGQRSLQNPLGELLTHALYGVEGGHAKSATRGLEKPQIEKCAMHLLTWEAVPGTTKK
jgi:hypothetical protein